MRKGKWLEKAGQAQSKADMEKLVSGLWNISGKTKPVGTGK